MTTPEESKPEERVLLAELIAGDRGAWKTFEARYRNQLLGCIRRIGRRFAPILPAEADVDVYADLMLELVADDCRKLRAFDVRRGTPLAAWLVMLARHATYDYLRSVRREPQHVSLAAAESLHAGEGDPMRELQARRRLRRLEATMTETDRHFMHLYMQREMTPEQIAEAMNVSVTTVYTRKHKIVRRFRKPAA